MRSTLQISAFTSIIDRLRPLHLPRQSHHTTISTEPRIRTQPNHLPSCSMSSIHPSPGPYRPVGVEQGRSSLYAKARKGGWVETLGVGQYTHPPTHTHTLARIHALLVVEVGLVVLCSRTDMFFGYGLDSFFPLLNLRMNG